MPDTPSKLRRRLLEAAAKRFPQGSGRPRGGWVRVTRQAVGMSQAQLAARAGVSRATVQKLERAEADRRITLASLDRLAAALGCQVAVALVPVGGSHDVLRAREAHAKADAQVDALLQSMSEEGESVAPDSRADIKQELVQALLEGDPRKLWR